MCVLCDKLHLLDNIQIGPNVLKPNKQTVYYFGAGDRNSVGARFSVPVQTGHGAHTASCTMGTGSFPGVKSGRGVTLTTHPF